jgi:hypothetical protein
MDLAMASNPVIVLLLLITSSFDIAAASLTPRQPQNHHVQAAGNKTTTSSISSVTVRTASLQAWKQGISSRRITPAATHSPPATRFTVAMLAAGDAWYTRMSMLNKVAYAFHHKYDTAIVSSSLPHSDMPQRSYAWQKVGGKPAPRPCKTL